MKYYNGPERDRNSELEPYLPRPPVTASLSTHSSFNTLFDELRVTSKFSSFFVPYIPYALQASRSLPVPRVTDQFPATSLGTALAAGISNSSLRRTIARKNEKGWGGIITSPSHLEVLNSLERGDESSNGWFVFDAEWDHLPHLFNDILARVCHVELRLLEEEGCALCQANSSFREHDESPFDENFFRCTLPTTLPTKTLLQGVVNTYLHEPNFCVVQTCCKACLNIDANDNHCTECGNDRTRILKDHFITMSPKVLKRAPLLRAMYHIMNPHNFTNFTTQLHYRLTLKGQGEVTLAEFQYSCSFTTKHEGQNICFTCMWYIASALVLKPSYATEELSAAAKKQADYIVNKVHGIPWVSSVVDYSLLESLISRATTRAETIYVKGAERKMFLAKYMPTPVITIYDRGQNRDSRRSDQTSLKAKTFAQTKQSRCSRSSSPVSSKLRLRSMKSTPSESSNTQTPQKISLTNHEISLRCMCGDRIIIISEKQDTGLKWVTYLSPSWARLCDVWDIIDVFVDHWDMWSTPVTNYCNDLIDTRCTLLKLDGHPYGGYFKFREPALMIRDPELIRSVIVKDFNSFLNNDFNVDIMVDPLFGRNPVVIKDQA
uniref:Uncharacterized protein n=1 Tax=Timema shepardi TaxID=629360 RepID=A0A7R9FZZ4_TIMSH|nr:unnamed protein product [Timema shepardi]